jgi:hypothetical protein
MTRIGVESGADHMGNSTPVDIEGQACRSVAQVNGCDHAVDHSSRGDGSSPDRPVEADRGIQFDAEGT